MAHLDQWGAHDQTHDVSRPGLYAKHPLPGAAYDQRNIEAPVYTDRFNPKPRIHDPFFLVIFVAQVLYQRFRRFLITLTTHERPIDMTSPTRLHRALVCGILRRLGIGTLNLDIPRRAGRWSRS
jgi:hypothetical protein